MCASHGILGVWWPTRKQLAVKILERQPQIPFDYAQVRPSTPLRFAQDDKLWSGVEIVRSWPGLVGNSEVSNVVSGVFYGWATGAKSDGRSSSGTAFSELEKENCAPQEVRV
jgi:hypothetical protein